jgi:hypothetical protein
MEGVRALSEDARPVICSDRCGYDRDKWIDDIENMQEYFSQFTKRSSGQML